MREGDEEKSARHRPALQAEEVLKEGWAGRGEDGFGVELDAFNGKVAVAKAHDDAVVGFGGNGEATREGAALDHQGMVARSGEGARKAMKNGFAIVADLAGLAVHEAGCADDAAAKGLADGLMAEADAQNGKLAGETANQFDADAGFARSAGAGRNDDALGAEGGDLVESDLVVAADEELLAHLAEDLGQVVGERIIIVDEEEHGLRDRGNLIASV